MRQKFRGLKAREGVIFRGAHGWGEFAPFDDHSDEHAANWLKAAIEMAYLPAPQSNVNCVRSNAIVPECDKETAPMWAALGDCRVAKVKVSGQPLARREDLDRLWVVAKTLGVNAKLRVDFNGSCTVKDATEFAEDCQGLPIEYLEQPCATLAECSEVRSLVKYPIAVDESIRLSKVASVSEAAQAVRDSADCAVLKPIPLGGLQATREWAKHLEMPVVISSSLDTSVGLSFVANVAAALAPDGTHGLGTGVLFGADLVRYPLVPHHGEIHVGSIEPDLVKLERASDATRGAVYDKWQMRMARCWQQLQGNPVLDLVNA